MNTVNKLKHNIRIEKGGIIGFIDIRLSDDCKNGHNDFAITGEFYQGFKAEKNLITARCCHDEILKYRPDLKIFVDLHLSNVEGTPMFAISNGFYHLRETGVNVAKSYIRATDNEMDLIKTAEDEQHFAYIINELNIPARWKKEANEAIKKLEEFTGEKFIDNSTKLEKVGISKKQQAETIAKIKSGYYTAESLESRKAAKIEQEKQDIINSIKSDRDKVIAKANKEFEVQMAVLNAGLSIENFIFYDHTDKGVFNWLDYKKKVTKEEFAAFLENVKGKLDDKIIFELK